MRITTARDLLAALRAHPEKDVYRSDHGMMWHLTYTPNCEVTKEAVEGAIASGVLLPTYSNTRDSWGIRPTLDIDATVAARNAGNRSAKIYVA